MLKLISQSYPSIRFPSLLPITASSKIAKSAILVDVIIALALLNTGLPMTVAHIAAFIATGALLLVLRLTHRDNSQVEFAGASRLRNFWAFVAWALLQLALRGGLMASLVHAGANESVALGLGILLATFIGNHR